MAQTTQHRGWFIVEGIQYGPATVEIAEEGHFERRMTRYRVNGSFVLDEDAEPLPFDTNDVKIVLDDGRQGGVLFTNLTNNRMGEFQAKEELRVETAT